MQEWEQGTRSDYARKGIGSRVGFGARPALVIVDFARAFTDPGSSLGGDFDAELRATARLLDTFRAAPFPVIYLTVAYAPDLHDGGVFVEKVPALGMLIEGSQWVEIDPRIAPSGDEPVIVKKYASAFFGTPLADDLRAMQVDTVVLAGCTTSGCIRASAVDSLQHGFRTIVVREAVGDRAEGPHEANLFDIDTKYGDVVDLDAAILSVETLAKGRPDHAGRVPAA